MKTKRQNRYPIPLAICILASLFSLSLPSAADTVRFFKITFEGTGTYHYYSTSSDSFYSKVSMNFNWNNIVETGFSEDAASSPETWGDLGFSALPIMNVSGALHYEGTDYNGYHNCTSDIVTDSWPKIAAMAALAPGYLFVTSPFGAFSVADHCVLDSGPFWDGEELSSSVIEPPEALAQNKIVQYVSGNKTLTNCDACSATVEWNGTVTFEKMSEYSSPTTPKSGYHSFSYDAIRNPSLNVNPALSKPIGLGSVAEGGNTVDIHVAFDQYPAPIDIYLGLYAPAINPDILLISPGTELAFQPLSQGLVAWKTNLQSAIDETVINAFPLSELPPGAYSLYMMATPAGRTDTYQLWITGFSK